MLNTLVILGIFQVKIVYAGNHGENILNKVRKLSKSAQEQKTLIITSVYFFTAIIKVFISWSKGTKLYIHPISTFY